MRTRRTVLVVDDDAAIVDSLRRTLRNEDYDLVSTTSAFEALAVVERGGADLVIADVDMPEMSGTDLVARIQKTHPHVVRILLTGGASLDSALAAINEGEVHRYLTKPWQKDKLREAIRAALARLEQLHAGAEATARVAGRDAEQAALERRYPGLGHADRPDGVYLVDAGRVERLIATLDSERARALLDPHTLTPASLAVTRRRSDP